MTDIHYRYPTSHSLNHRLRAHGILAEALLQLKRYKEAADVCDEAFQIQEQLVNPDLFVEQMLEISGLRLKIRRKLDEEIQLLRNGDPYEVRRTCL